MVGHALLDTAERYIPVPVLNLSDDVLEITEGTSVGCFESVVEVPATVGGGETGRLEKQFPLSGPSGRSSGECVDQVPRKLKVPEKGNG